MPRSGDLSEPQMLAWRRFLRAHALVTRRLEHDLLTEQRLPLASYDVLVQLVEAPERRLRMSGLAERVLLSRSGLTRLVDRLEREGLVRREACDEDARGLFTVLTDAGLERLREASPVHLRGVAEHAMGRLDDAEAAALAGLLAKLVDQDVETQVDLRPSDAGAGSAVGVSPAG
ncbi:MAG: MarR family transcriptional regulator [Sporichthyaceae bacterium]